MRLLNYLFLDVTTQVLVKKEKKALFIGTDNERVIIFFFEIINNFKKGLCLFQSFLIIANNIRFSDMQLTKGTILVSEPFLQDANFVRTVILLCEHSEAGSFGFVLNKPTTFMLQEVAEEVLQSDMPLFVGGPVEQNTLHYIHNEGDNIENSINIGEQIFWGGDYEKVKELINSFKISPEQIRFFLGYSGWAAGQLQSEIDDNVWIATNTGHHLIFDTSPENLWREILKNMGGKYREMANYPIDPRLN